MGELNERIASLSPAKRALLDKRVSGLWKNSNSVTQVSKRDLTPLVFQSDGDGTPLFLLHYLTPSQVLARHLGPCRPVFGIDSAFEEEMYLWEETGRIEVSVEELATRCLAEVLNAQPRGPYCLAGFCFGGVLAFEIAKHLSNRGEVVAFLGLLDSFYLPGVDPLSVPWLSTSYSADERSPDITDSEREFLRRVAFMRELLKPYKSEPYLGRAVLFRAMAGRDPSVNANGWSDVLVGGVQLEDCQSTRIGLFEEPFVAELAARLGQHLSRIDECHCKGEAGQEAVAVPNHEPVESESLFVAPRTPIERVLADIWSRVLPVQQVGVHDNFFKLGGDLILSIQVVARARKAGLRLTVRQIFQHQTIAELALVAETATPPQFEQGLITGEVPLTPIQRWFFEQAYADQHHWNQATLLELKQDLDPALLEKAIRQLALHHDALRLRFQPSDSGWTQFNAGDEEAVKLVVVDLARTPEEKQTSAMETAAAGLQASLNLSRGPLIRAALFKFGSRRPSRLLLAVHHLAVDGVSWRILLEDLQVLCEQLRRGRTIRLPDKTTSFRRWAQELAEHARSATLEQEADYWLAVSSAKSGRIPVDFSGGRTSRRPPAPFRCRWTPRRLPRCSRRFHKPITPRSTMFSCPPWASH